MNALYCVIFLAGWFAAVAVMKWLEVRRLRRKLAEMRRFDNSDRDVRAFWA